MSEEYKMKIGTEKRELDLKIKKLYFFMKTDPFENMGFESTALLIDQHKTMREYSRILDQRIKLMSDDKAVT